MAGEAQMGGQTRKPAIKHPFSGAIYELQSDGNVLIRDKDKQGLFKRDGRWISGELREADPQMCVWISNQPPPADELESTWALSQET